jgi:hypothetical protein
VVNKDSPYWLRPTAGSLEPFLITDAIERAKFNAGAQQRLHEANSKRQEHNKVGYVPFAANHFGTLGRACRPLLSALAVVAVRNFE